MTERAYTVRELDELRQAVERKWFWGAYRIPLTPPNADGYSVRLGRTHKGAESDIAIEQIVRTHMLAGHTAADLLASEPA